MRPLRILASVCLAAAAISAQAAGDPKAGGTKVYQCQGCHGIKGWKTAFPEVYQVPRLGGQNPAYIIAALKEYKNGDRDFATMRAIAGPLSDQDMEDIAAYYGAGTRGAASSETPKQQAGGEKK